MGQADIRPRRRGRRRRYVGPHDPGPQPWSPFVSRRVDHLDSPFAWFALLPPSLQARYLRYALGFFATLWIAGTAGLLGD